ncbi:hypothetical protein IFM89_017269 [Coptis chinensis]|uniref:Uncharacterized protein n=1 Tax=Coptis chinensis TaxID=261450 RepID=A0A835M555_9MAGN|nr:hypothetical protein IFM89_017269 [Coptis chinensis]
MAIMSRIAWFSRQVKRPYGLCVKVSAVTVLGLCFIFMLSTFSPSWLSLNSQRSSFSDIAEPVVANEKREKGKTVVKQLPKEKKVEPHLREKDKTKGEGAVHDKKKEEVVEEDLERENEREDELKEDTEVVNDHDGVTNGDIEEDSDVDPINEESAAEYTEDENAGLKTTNASSKNGRFSSLSRRKLLETHQEVINAIMSAYDAFVLIPIGGGKNLTYQVDDRSVLKHFDWHHAMREASFEYHDLMKLGKRVTSFVDDPKLPCEVAMKKMY